MVIKKKPLQDNKRILMAAFMMKHTRETKNRTNSSSRTTVDTVSLGTLLPSLTLTGALLSEGGQARPLHLPHLSSAPPCHRAGNRVLPDC